MSRLRARWRGNAIAASAIPDELEENAQVATLTVRLAPGSTPPNQVGREVDVILTRPMLEYLALLAEEIDAVEYVEVVRSDEEATT